MVGDVSVKQFEDVRVVYLADDAGHQDVNDIFAYLVEHLAVCLFLVAVHGLHEIVVLGGNHDGVHAHRLPVCVIFDGHLAFGIRTEVGHFLAFAPYVGQHAQDFVAQVEGQRHEVFCFVGGVAEHHALVARTLLHGVFALHAPVDVRALFMDGRQHATAFGFELVFRFGVANAADGAPRDFLQIDISF